MKTLRILHTADWHLGATLESVSREPEQALFLDWLAEQLVAREVDVLIVAGDVFDQAQPSAEAQRLYYGFLHRVARGGRVRKVVVVGGNHDSPSRLDAPRELLGALDVHVVGGFDRDALDRCVCPVFTSDGGSEAAASSSTSSRDAAAVVLAVPYVHEVRLGLRSVLEGGADLARELRDRFADLYRALADRAEALAPGAPIVATGHLACVGAQRDDAPAEINLIGSLGGLPPDLFDPRIRYVALGHIHRGYRVGESHAWYPGSPVALSLKETRPARQVLVVEIPSPHSTAEREPSVERVEVPTFRPIVELRGDVDGLAAALRELTWEAPLPPLVYAVLEADRIAAGVPGLLHEAAAENPRGAVELVQIRPTLSSSPPGLDATAGGNGDDAAQRVRLADLEPEQVFLRLCQAKGVGVPDDALLNAFRAVLSSAGGREGAAE